VRPGDDERDRARGGGDHGGAPAGERDDDGEHERREEPDPRIDAGDHRERDGLGDEGERHHESGEHLAREQPGAAQRLEHGGLDAIAIGGFGDGGHG
jgi:hypothetical protein